MADDRTGSIDWEAVTKAVSITENRFIDDNPNLCILVQKYGGGSDGRFIRRLTNFVTSSVPDNRRLPSSFWSSLSKLDVEASALSFVIWAIVKAEATAPPHAVSSGVTHYITSSHVSVLAEEWKKASMIKANQLMKEYHETADCVGIHGRDRIRIVDQADLLIIRLSLIHI